jgi:nucleotide-binding universal stress UspA family protein
MRMVLCLDVEDEFATVEALTRLAPVQGASIELFHVKDIAEGEEFEDAMRPGLIRPRVKEARTRATVERREVFDQIRQRAMELLSSCGASEVTLALREGRPERAIVTHLEENAADLCVIARRSDWVEAAVMGPKSVGHVARFVTDHAPCAVLLLR